MLLYLYCNKNSLLLQEELIPVNQSSKPIYPTLDRAAFLIERICVPRYYPPTFCAETAQLLAMLEAAGQKSIQQEKDP